MLPSGTSQVCIVKGIQLLATIALGITLVFGGGLKDIHQDVYTKTDYSQSLCQKQKSELNYFLGFPKNKLS